MCAKNVNSYILVHEMPEILFISLFNLNFRSFIQEKCAYIFTMFSKFAAKTWWCRCWLNVLLRLQSVAQ